MELTEVGFWDDYWAGCKIPTAVDYADPFDRTLAASLKEALKGRAGSVLEVGCAPGKWLAFAAKELKLVPSGIEYSKAGMAATMQNLKALGIKYGEIMTGDFFAIAPCPRFDVVMSFGFIEHFNDPGPVIDRHLQWLRPGGALVLGVPNFRGIYAPVQRLLDKKILDVHNTDIMSVDYMANAASLRGLDVKFLRYIGSFEPALPVPPRRTRNPFLLALKLSLRVARRIRRFEIFDNLNHPYFSSYILMVCEKGE